MKVQAKYGRRGSLVRMLERLVIGQARELERNEVGEEAVLEILLGGKAYLAWGGSMLRSGCKSLQS